MIRRRQGPATRRLRLAFVAGTLVLGVAGTAGIVQYARTYWLYRGFSAPRNPATVVSRGGKRVERVKVGRGTQEVIYVRSAAIGNRSEAVYVYLPPGYFHHPKERYPVYYALHGSPGEAIDFDRVLDMGVAEDVLIAEHKIRPMIIVSPTGAPSPFADDEWANGVRRGQDWATYVSRDVVRAIDRRFRTIRKGSDRAIAGLSEGGYGALNIAIHNPGEFRVVESWSGYMLADKVTAVWGAHPSASLLAYNSPLLQVRHVARELRRDQSYFWFYCGSGDTLATQNVLFARALHKLAIPHKFQVRPGGHSWKLWRPMVNSALIVASEHFAGG